MFYSSNDNQPENEDADDNDNSDDNDDDEIINKMSLNHQNHTNTNSHTTTPSNNANKTISSSTLQQRSGSSNIQQSNFPLACNPVARCKQNKEKNDTEEDLLMFKKNTEKKMKQKMQVVLQQKLSKSKKSYQENLNCTIQEVKQRKKSLRNANQE